MARFWRHALDTPVTPSLQERRQAYDRLLAPALYAPGDGALLLGLSMVVMGCLGLLGMSVVLLLARGCC